MCDGEKSRFVTRGVLAGVSERESVRPSAPKTFLSYGPQRHFCLTDAKMSLGAVRQTFIWDGRLRQFFCCKRGLLGTPQPLVAKLTRITRWWVLLYALC